MYELERKMGDQLNRLSSRELMLACNCSLAASLQGTRPIISPNSFFLPCQSWADRQEIRDFFGISCHLLPTIEYEFLYYVLLMLLGHKDQTSITDIS